MSVVRKSDHKRTTQLPATVVFGARAVRYMDEAVVTASISAKETLTHLCEVRDQFAALAADGEAGRLSAAEYNKRHQELMQEHRRLGQLG